MIPPLRLGSVALDLSFLIVIVAAYVLLRVNRPIFLGLTGTLGPGHAGHAQALLFDRQNFRDER